MLEFVLTGILLAGALMVVMSLWAFWRAASDAWDRERRR